MTQLQKGERWLASIITRRRAEYRINISPPNTTDFAIMYLPMEALYAYVMQLSGTVEALQREKHGDFGSLNTICAVIAFRWAEPLP